MKEVFKFLEQANILYVATIDGEKPSLRPFSDAFCFNDKIYLVTDRTKAVGKQIARNNNVCIVSYNNEKWVRINCILVEDKSKEARSEALNKVEWASALGYSLENEDFEVLYISNAKATIYDIEGTTLLDTTF